MSGRAKRPIEKKKVEAAPSSAEVAAESRPQKVCFICKIKPTISDSSPYCASCMGRKGNEKRRQAAAAALGEEKHTATVVDKGLGGKSSPRANMRVDIDFSKHPLIYKQISDLADQEIRPLDLQIIYLLKRNLETAKASLGGGLDRS